MNNERRDELPECFLGVDDEVLASLVSGVRCFEPEVNVSPTDEVLPPEPLELTVEIGVLRLTVRQLCRAKEGDIFELTMLGNDEVILALEGEPVLHGRLLLCGKSVAVQLSAPVQESA